MDWHPWGEEAFALAREENKPIFLSVGFSTCTGCHTMNRESFMDPEVAAFMSERFVNIKVDSEERPDVAGLYLMYMIRTTGSGSHPINAWLTPGLEPLFAQPYLPAVSSDPRFPSFMDAARRMSALWEAEEEALRANGAAAIEALTALQNPVRRAADAPRVEDPAQELFEALYRAHEPNFGGFTPPPKFPRVATLFFLHHFASTREGTAADSARALALLTLRGLERGGIHDHIGGGFHRYSLDHQWHVPHFEKTLYDQALMTLAFLQARQLEDDPRFTEAVESTLAYAKRVLALPNDLFASAEDSESLPEPGASEKLEGAYNVWTQTEIDNLLGDEDGPLFRHVYGVVPGGNVAPATDPRGRFQGTNVLIRRRTRAEAAERFGLSPEEVDVRLRLAREELLHARSRRPRPAVDGKAISGWNGLMISALARASSDLNRPRYAAAAARTADAVLERLWDADARVLRRVYLDGPGRVDGVASDYAFFIQGLLDLHDATGEARWLAWADTLQTRMDELFYDPVHGGYFETDGLDPSILVRLRDDFDGAMPAATSVAVSNLLRLVGHRHDSVRQERVLRSLRAHEDILLDHPIAMPLLMVSREKL